MQQFWKRLLIVLIGIVVGFAVVGFSLYSWAWFTYVGRAQKQIESVWAHADADYHLTFTGTVPHLGGFPRVPHLEYSGKLMHAPSGLSLDIPLLTHDGFPVPGQVQVIKAPQGMTVVAPVLGRTLQFTNISMQIELPNRFMKSFSKADIGEWQKLNDPVVIQNLDLTTTSNIHITGNGMVGLDESLQLAGQMEARIVGLDKLLDDVGDKGNDRQVKDSNIARQFLKMMMRTDEKTGEEYFQTTLRIQDGSFYFGPLRFAAIPVFDWGDAPIVTPHIRREAD